MTSIHDSAKFKIDYCKKTLEDLEPLVETCKTLGVLQLQQYNPLYDDFFVLSNKNYDSISLNHPYHAVDSTRIVHMETREERAVPVHFKFSPLLDPIRYLIGKYDVKDPRARNLPKYGAKDESIDKLTKPNNASYIDNFFCYLSSQLLNVHGIKHGINYYGSYLGIQENYKIDIMEDIDYLNQSRFFTDNKGVLYDIDATELANYSNYGSRSNKNKIQINSTTNCSDISLEFEDIGEIVEGVVEIIDGGAEGDDGHTGVVEDGALDGIENIYEKSSDSRARSESGSESDSENSSNNSDINYSTDNDAEDVDNVKDTDSYDDDGDNVFEDIDSDDDDDDANYEDIDSDEDSDDDDDDANYEDIDSDEDSDADESLHAYIKNFPVQMICLEKCEGTLDEMFINKTITPQIAASVFMQIIMSLIIYQKMFSMTHNDLHTNNIMYVSTDEPFLYYQYSGNIYKVPTYGKIYKIIDFGRAIYKYGGKVFCSDSFAHDGDASTQYNCEPFFNKKKPRLDPNMSFDLCRLGCSIYDFIIHDDTTSPIDDLQATILRWCKDDHEKNVLYKKTGEERYPNFKLYKMIARTVHAHTPDAQLEFPYFAQFLTQIVDADADILDIDALPSYVLGTVSNHIGN